MPPRVAPPRLIVLFVVWDEVARFWTKRQALTWRGTCLVHSHHFKHITARKIGMDIWVELDLAFDYPFSFVAQVGLGWDGVIWFLVHDVSERDSGSDNSTSPPPSEAPSLDFGENLD